MFLLDVNVLLYAYREDTEYHSAANAFAQSLINSDGAYGYSELIASSFLRIVTHPRIFNPPTPLASALSYLQAFAERGNAVKVAPGSRHWSIFCSLIKQAKAKGNLIPDAYFAALAIEHGCTWVTYDQDYTRFKGLDLKLM